VRIRERDNLGRKIRYFYYIPVNYSWDILSIKLGAQTINAQYILSFAILLRNTKEKRIIRRERMQRLKRALAIDIF